MSLGRSFFRLVGSAARSAINNQKRVEKALKVISESLELSKTSPKPETRISRMGVAVERIADLCSEFPQWPDARKWHLQGLALTEGFPAFMIDNLSALIAEDVAKIEKLRSQAARHKRAENLIAKLAPYMHHTMCDMAWLSIQMLLIKKAYPGEGKTPEKERDIPTPWDCPQQLVEQPTERAQTLEYASLGTASTPFKSVSWLGMLGIWLLWGMMFSPLTQKGGPYGLVSFLGSVALTIFTVKWINRRRAKAVIR